MRFQFDATILGSGLRLIEEFPDQRLCRLEGRNGIGKTMAVRLLQLITGDQPYAGLDRSWQSLRASLGPTTITASGLRLPSDDGLHELQWQLDPSAWPITPSEHGPWTSALLDGGQPLERDEIRRILRIFRIAGDESLAQSFAGTVNLDRQRLRGLSDLVFTRADAWDRRLQALVDVTGTATAESLALNERRLSEASSELDKVGSYLSIEETRRRRLREILKLIAARAAIQEQLPGLVSQREELERNQRQVRRELAALDEQAAQLRSKAERDQDAMSQLIHDADLLRKRQERLAKRQREVHELQRALDLSDIPQLSQVQQLQRDNSLRLTRAKTQRGTLDRAGLLMDVSDDLRGTLDHAIRRDLGDEVIADVGDTSLSVTVLADGVQKRRDALRDEVSDEGSQLQAEIAELERQSTLLEKLARSVRLLGIAQEDLGAILQQVDQQMIALSEDAAQQYRSLNEQRTAKLDELESLAADMHEINRGIEDLLSSGDPSAIEARLAELDAVGMTAQDASAKLQESDERGQDLVTRQDVLQRASDAARHSLRLDRASLRRTVEDLLSPEWSWLAKHGVDFPDPQTPLKEQALVVDTLRRGAERLQDELEGVRNDLVSLAQALEVVSSALRRGATEAVHPTQRFASTVLDYYEEVFTRQLAADEVRRALFDNGSDIELDLRQMMASWLTQTGERRQRPLEAFSSGERAFAYTRVQLERLKEHQAANKVAFLDEFGAYVARDRLQDLLSFLQRRALHGLVDQVVIILPLTSQPRGEQAAQLKQRDYFTVDLTDAGAFTAVNA